MDVKKIALMVAAVIVGLIVFNKFIPASLKQ